MQLYWYDFVLFLFTSIRKENVSGSFYKNKSKHFALSNISFNLYWAFRALRAHLLFKLWTFSLCVHFKTKTKKSSRISWKNFGDFEIFFENRILFADFIKKIVDFQNLKIWARSVQPFWRLLDTNKQTNKQSNKQTDKSNLYIDESSYFLILHYSLVIL